MFLVALLFALFASLFGVSKATLEHCDPFFLIGARMFFAGILLTTYAFYKGKKTQEASINFSKIFTKSFFIQMTLLGVFNIYLTNIFEIWGIKHLVSAKACLLYSLSPFLSAMISYLILKEKMTTKRFLGMMIGFLGLMPIMYDQLADPSMLQVDSWLHFGEIAILAAVVCSVIGWILLKNAMSNSQVSPFLANGLSMLIGGVLALIHSYLTEDWNPIPVSNLSPFLINSLYMCLVSNIICYNLYGYLLKSYSATFMSFAGLITPIFASLFGFLLLDETVNASFFLSLGIFSLGLFVFHKDEMEKVEMEKKLKENLI